MRIPGRNLLRSCGRLILQRLAPGPRILLYHRVARLPSDPQLLAVTPEHFAQHMELLQKHCVVMPLSELVRVVQQGRASRRMIAITFDDGYADNLHQALPLLEKYGMPATVYVASGTLDTPREFWWDELHRLLLLPGRLPAVIRVLVRGEEIISALGDSAAHSERQWKELSAWSVVSSDDPSPRHALYRQLCRHFKLMRPSERETVLSDLRAQIGVGEVGRETHRALTGQELRKLATGDIEIGGHTVSHSSLGVLSPEEQRAEIQDGNRGLERILGQPITSFSYPFGCRTDFTAETVGVVRHEGLAYACANYEERLHRSSDFFRLPRHVVRNWSRDQFNQWLRTW